LGDTSVCTGPEDCTGVHAGNFTCFSSNTWTSAGQQVTNDTWSSGTFVINGDLAILKQLTVRNNSTLIVVGYLLVTSQAVFTTDSTTSVVIQGNLILEGTITFAGSGPHSANVRVEGCVTFTSGATLLTTSALSQPLIEASCFEGIYGVSVHGPSNEVGCVQLTNDNTLMVLFATLCSPSSKIQAYFAGYWLVGLLLLHFAIERYYK